MDTRFCKYTTSKAKRVFVISGTFRVDIKTFFFALGTFDVSLHRYIALYCNSPIEDVHCITFYNHNLYFFLYRFLNFFSGTERERGIKTETEMPQNSRSGSLTGEGTYELPYITKLL